MTGLLRSRFSQRSHLSFWDGDSIPQKYFVYADKMIPRQILSEDRQQICAYCFEFSPCVFLVYRREADHLVAKVYLIPGKLSNFLLTHPHVRQPVSGDGALPSADSRRPGY